MVRIELYVELNYEIDEHGADFVFSIHAAHTPNQTVFDESLVLSQPLVAQMHTDSVTGNRYMRLRAAPGELKLSYAATVDLAHHRADPVQLAEVPVRLGGRGGDVAHLADGPNGECHHAIVDTAPVVPGTILA